MSSPASTQGSPPTMRSMPSTATTRASRARRRTNCSPNNWRAATAASTSMRSWRSTAGRPSMSWRSAPSRPRRAGRLRRRRWRGPRRGGLAGRRARPRHRLLDREDDRPRPADAAGSGAHRGGERLRNLRPRLGGAGKARSRRLDGRLRDWADARRVPEGGRRPRPRHDHLDPHHLPGRSGPAFSLANAARFIAERSAAPVWSVYDTFIGRGAVGARCSASATSARRWPSRRSRSRRITSRSRRCARFRRGRYSTGGICSASALTGASCRRTSWLLLAHRAPHCSTDDMPTFNDRGRSLLKVARFPGAARINRGRRNFS